MGYSVTGKKGPKKEKLDKNFAKFDTSGKGMKLMQKMGFKMGQGLGKHSQGMLNPIEQKVRKRGAGLGAAGTERTKQSLIHFPVKKSDDEEDSESDEEDNSRRGSRRKGQKRKSGSDSEDETAKETRKA